MCLSEFEEKPEASKCGKCRHRGRQNYFARKKYSLKSGSPYTSADNSSEDDVDDNSSEGFVDVGRASNDSDTFKVGTQNLVDESQDISSVRGICFDVNTAITAATPAKNHPAGSKKTVYPPRSVQRNDTNTNQLQNHSAFPVNFQHSYRKTPRSVKSSPKTIVLSTPDLHSPCIFSNKSLGKISSSKTESYESNLDYGIIEASMTWDSSNPLVHLAMLTERVFSAYDSMESNKLPPSGGNTSTGPTYSGLPRDSNAYKLSTPTVTFEALKQPVLQSSCNDQNDISLHKDYDYFCESALIRPDLKRCADEIQREYKPVHPSEDYTLTAGTDQSPCKRHLTNPFCPQISVL